MPVAPFTEPFEVILGEKVPVCIFCDRVGIPFVKKKRKRDSKDDGGVDQRAVFGCRPSLRKKFPWADYSAGPIRTLTCGCGCVQFRSDVADAPVSLAGRCSLLSRSFRRTPPCPTRTPMHPARSTPIRTRTDLSSLRQYRGLTPQCRPSSTRTLCLCP